MNGRNLRRLTLGLACLVAVGCSRVASNSLNSEGVRLYQMGQYQQAAETFARAAATDPRSATSYYNQAAALHKSGTLGNRPTDLAQAERLYNQCLEYDPNHAECYRALAVLLTETNRRDAAFRLLEGWAGRSPQLANPRIELARLLEETGSTDQATARLVEALSVEPQNSRALTALGRLREMQGDRAQALANYQRSLAVNRFQPEISARVAALQGLAIPSAAPLSAPGVAAPALPALPAGPPATAAPVIAAPLPADTRTAEQWSPSVRY